MEGEARVMGWVECPGCGEEIHYIKVKVGDEAGYISYRDIIHDDGCGDGS